ncbi:MAG: alpha/beta fold hydrolase [Oculatellaceae cyanobacterium Prado106]|jgi:hypothetical protein|nr:alpha/beta fold hydrolase [Oculatellaceae cyanobacterium Prado106]
MISYFYLHGLASSPQSYKAVELRDRFQSRHIPCTCPDFNQGDFFNLTLTRQIQQVEALLHQPSNQPLNQPLNQQPVYLIGSSLGGLTAAWLAERNPAVQRILLLAPAFEFLQHWLPQLGDEQVALWRQARSLPLYHYGAKRKLPLGDRFLLDLEQYDDRQLQRPIPMLILHGLHDEVIPVEASRRYAAERPWVELVELESDHGLGNAIGEIWDQAQRFFDLS